MTFQPKPLQVEAIPNERLVFWVHSEDNPEKKYRVDLLQHDGRGWCSCPDWKIRRWPLIAINEPITNPSVFCKHVDACRRHVINATLLDLSKKENPPHGQA